MKTLLVSLLLVISGCGMYTYQSETKHEKETTYVPLDIQEQILGYTKGDCSTGDKRQRIFGGGVPFLDGADKYVYQLLMVLNLSGTYDLQLRTFKNEIEVGSATYQVGSYQVDSSEVHLQNIGAARVQLGASTSKILFEYSTPQGPALMVMRAMWDENDITGTPLCP